MEVKEKAISSFLAKRIECELEGLSDRLYSRGQVTMEESILRLRFLFTHVPSEGK